MHPPVHGAARESDSLAELLAWQHGVLSRAQAAEHGISDNALAARLRSGKWQRVRPGVYATFSGPLPRQSQLWAALLYAGPGAALCDQSAAEIDRLIDPPRDSTIHVLVPAHRRIRSQAGIHVRRSRRHAEAVRLGASPPRTRIEETVLDLVNRAPTPDAALAVLAGACQRRLTTPGRLAAVCGTRRNLRWRSFVQPALRDIAGGAHSLLELRYVRDVERRHGLPTGRRQRSVRRVYGREWTDVSYDDGPATRQRRRRGWGGTVALWLERCHRSAVCDGRPGSRRASDPRLDRKIAPLWKQMRAIARKKLHSTVVVRWAVG